MNFCIILLKEQIYRKERIITRMLNKEKKKKGKQLRMATPSIGYIQGAMKPKVWAINANPKVQHNLTAEFSLE